MNRIIIAGLVIVAAASLVSFGIPAGGDLADFAIASSAALPSISGLRRIPGPHGIVAVRANSGEIAGLVRQMNAGIEDFKDKHRRELSAVASSVDDVLARVTALQVGGGGSTLTGASKRTISAFGCVLKTGGLNEAYASVDFSVQVDREGGFTAPSEVDQEVQRKLRDMSPMRRICDVRLISKGSFERVFNLRGTDSGWVGEKQARPQTDGDQWALLTIPVHEQYAMPAVTQTLLDDSDANVADEVITSITDAFNDQEEGAFVSGNGIKKPKGFLSYDKVTTADATRAADKLQYIASGAAGAFPDLSGVAGAKDADALLTMVYTLRTPYRQGAVWLMNSMTALAISKLKDGDGRYIWRQSMAAGQPPTLHGYPVEIDEGMPDIEADAYPVAFGNFRRGYQIVDRQGVRVVRDPYSNKPYVLFYTTKRVGGSLNDSDAIKLLKMAAS